MRRNTHTIDRIIWEKDLRRNLPNIAGKYLKGCDLSHVNLSGVDIRGTTFSGCILYNTDFTGAIYDDRTKVWYAGQKKPWVNHASGKGRAKFDDEQIKQFFGTKRKVRFELHDKEVKGWVR